VGWSFVDTITMLSIKRAPAPTFRTGTGTASLAFYTASYILIEIVGFVLIGVIAALVLRKRSPAV